MASIGSSIRHSATSSSSSSQDDDGDDIDGLLDEFIDVKRPQAETVKELEEQFTKVDNAKEERSRQLDPLLKRRTLDPDLMSMDHKKAYDKAFSYLSHKTLSRRYCDQAAYRFYCLGKAGNHEASYNLWLMFELGLLDDKTVTTEYWYELNTLMFTAAAAGHKLSCQKITKIIFG